MLKEEIIWYYYFKRKKNIFILFNNVCKESKRRKLLQVKQKQPISSEPRINMKIGQWHCVKSRIGKEKQPSPTDRWVSFFKFIHVLALDFRSGGSKKIITKQIIQYNINSKTKQKPSDNIQNKQFIGTIFFSRISKFFFN